MRLQGTVPVDELLGNSSASVTADHDGCRNIVMKRGTESKLTAGIVLDVESVARHGLSSV